MGLFWLFLFRFRNNRIHGISIPTCFRSGSLFPFRFYQPKASCDRRGWPRWISRHSVHSVIGSTMNGMIFRSFRKRNSSQKNTNTVYSEYSYSGIVPKERVLSVTLFQVCGKVLQEVQRCQTVPTGRHLPDDGSSLRHTLQPAAVSCRLDLSTDTNTSHLRLNEFNRN